MRLVEIISEAGLPVNPTRYSNTDDHTLEDATNYIKSNYKFTKKYTIPQISLSFFVGAVSGEYLDKEQEVRSRRGAANLSNVDSFVDSMNFQKNPYFSGDAQFSPSIGYSWYTMEDKSNNTAFLYYEDRGMGHDEVIIAANDKIELDKIKIALINAGIVKSPGDLNQRKQELAQNRMASIDKKGIKIGSLIDVHGDNTSIQKVLAIRPSGHIDTEIVKNDRWPDLVGQKRILKAANVLKKNVR